MPTNEELLERIAATLEAVAADVRALDLSGGGGNGGGNGEGTSADAAAVAKIRTGQRVQIVPRRNGAWRVDWREANQTPHKGPERPSIAEALAAVEREPTFPELPEVRALTAEEEQALGRLGALGDRGSCSVRFEKSVTFADHNWGNPDGVHTKFPGKGLLIDPIEHLERAHG